MARQIGNLLARCVVAACVLAMPMQARPQTTATGTLTISEGDNPQQTPSRIMINSNECSGATPDNLTFTWSIPTATPGTATFRIDVSNLDGCPIATGNNGATTQQGFVSMITNGQLPTGVFPPTQNAQQTVSASTVIPALRKATSTLDCTSQDTTIFFCLVETDGTTNQANGSIQLQVRPPGPPTITEATPVDDGTLGITWTPPSSATNPPADSYIITATADPARDPASPHNKSIPSGTTGRVDGLVNSVPYSITVQALSIGGNGDTTSTSQAVTATPQPVDDFWKSYQGDQGREPGGCSAGGAAAAMLAPLVLVALWFRRRRS